jgi:hypothetical protein
MNIKVLESKKFLNRSGAIDIREQHFIGGNTAMKKRPKVEIDKTRLFDGKMEEPYNNIFWYLGGFLYRAFGYSRKQLYLNRLDRKNIGG